MKTWIAGEVLFASDLNAEYDNILQNPISLLSPWTGNLTGAGFNLVDLGELEFRDQAADPTADGRIRRSGDEVTLRMQDARTNTVARPWAIWVDTTGAPAAGIGVGMLFQAESGDENPSDFGALDFVASDVGAATEDTYASIMLRVAGRALDEKYRFASTAGDGFTAIFAHANTADRTYTLPDADATLGGATSAATQAEMEAATLSTVYASPGRTQYHPGVAKGWARFSVAGVVDASYNVTSVTDNGIGDWTVNWTTAFSAATGYTVVLGYNSDNTVQEFPKVMDTGFAVGSTRINSVLNDGTLTDITGTAPRLMVAALGDQ